eukprot:m.467099 g.467099  ORF g.467099 m.467099 type:complete len:297 (-) comp25884_c0_seq1:323-1213(-)
MSRTVAGRKLRVLCLHGYGQTPTAFREKTGGFRKGVKGQVNEFVWLAAPHTAVPRADTVLTAPLAAVDPHGAAEISDSGDSTGFSWYDFDSIHKGEHERFLHSIQLSLDLIDATCERDGPFDGIFGFSQGASLAALILALQESRARGTERTWAGSKLYLKLGSSTAVDFALLVAGFLPGQGRTTTDSQLDSDDILQPVFVAAAPLCTPTLIVHGAADRIIPSSRSLAMAELFTAPVIVEHDGGHHVPSSAPVRKALQAFVKGEHMRLIPAQNGQDAAIPKSREALSESEHAVTIEK